MSLIYDMEGVSFSGEALNEIFQKAIHTIKCILRGLSNSIVFHSLKIEFDLANSAQPDEMPPSSDN